MSKEHHEKAEHHDKAEHDKAETQRLMDEQDRDKAEIKRLRAELSSRPRADVVPTKPATLAVVPEDITDPKIRALLAKAKGFAPRYVDSPEGRKPLAAAAQDHLIALRDLDVSYSGHGVALYAGGDLYVMQRGAHPRKVGAMLEETHDVATLTDLVDELDQKLNYEAS